MESTDITKLLIVDDEAAQMKALCQTLECEGYSVTGFTSATKAVATLREQAFDLVLSDLMMPEMDGITMLETAFEIDPSLVGIVMTGHGTIDTAVRAMKHGAHDYILKPFKLSAILPVLARALAVRRLRLENVQLYQAVGLYELSMSIALAPDSHTVLQKITDAALRQSGARHVSVLLPTRNGQDLTVAVSRGDNPGLAHDQRVRFGKELSRWVEQSRELLSRQGELPEFQALYTTSLPGLPRGMSVPMLVCGRLVGILHFCSAQEGVPISPGPIKALNVVATTAASALERILLIEELSEAEQRYRRLSENAPDVVSRYELHPRRRFAYISPVVETISGYSSEEHYANPDLSLKMIHPDDHLLFESVLRGDHPSGSTVTLRWIHKNGTVVWIEQKNVLVQDAEGHLVAIEGIARDISDRMKLEEQFRQAQRLEGVGRLAGGVAHDFNNLLTVINGYTEMVLDEMPSNDPFREALTGVRSAGERAAGLTQQLLAFSRKQLVNPTVLNLNATVLDIEKMLRRLIGEDIDLCTNLSPDLCNVLADAGQLHQVIMNLAVNSRDAMPDGGALIIETSNVSVDETYITMERPDAREGPHVMLAVSDSGMGMTQEVQARIFEPFFTTKPQGIGTGLGLATVFGIVKQAGGWIGLYSELGHGTTFKIYFPRIDQSVVPEKTVTATDMRGMRGTETILVVEDQTDVLRLTVGALKKLGYNVFSAARPEEALVWARSFTEPIQLLVTDVVMPGMTGRQLATEMVNLLPTLHVLFMSGYTDDAIGHQGVLDPGVAYLAKPFTANSLGRKVRETLGPRVTSTANILLADDDDDIRKLLRASLTTAGYNVLEAANGKEACRLLSSCIVNLVIIDLVMPEQEGLESIQRIRREWPKVKIIAISGAFGGDYLQTAKHLGATTTLPKPIDHSDLLRLVRTALQGPDGQVGTASEFRDS